jgi:hypothetical protein
MRLMSPFLAVLVLLSVAPMTWSQTEGAKLKVRAVLVDKDLNQKPVPKLALPFVNRVQE